MKKIITLIASIVLFYFQTNAQVVTIPDTAFLIVLLNNPSINTNTDGFIQVSEAQSYTGSIVASGLGITDMTGIEQFSSIVGLDCSSNSISNLNTATISTLSILDCSNNQLTSLNLYYNYNLTQLSCNNNSLSALDVSVNTALTLLCCSVNQLNLLNVSMLPNLSEFNCSGNQLTGIDVMQNTSLYDFNCSGNQISSLNLTNNTSLTFLDCSYNHLTNIDISFNPALEYLDCGANQLSVINLTNNINLLDLRCYANTINSLTVSQIPTLHGIHCPNNQITTLDLSANLGLTVVDCSFNSLSDLNVKNGNNSNVTSFNATNNSALTCIQVDDTIFSNNNWALGKDAGTKFKLNCGPCVVYIPDPNFKAALLGNPSINTNSNGEIECSEASSYAGVIFVSNLNISDVTGIEAFTSITNFSCTSNNISSIDLSNNTALLSANCSFNQVTNLLLPPTSIFSELSCYNNQLTTLDLSSNSGLTYLDCYSNLLQSINTAFNPLLNYFYCNNNSISSLDVSSNSALIQFNCSFNQLSNLNLQNGNNINFTYFQAQGNSALSCIQVDDVLWALANWTGNVDASASFNLACLSCNVYIPDPNFKSALLGISAINTNNNGEIECSEAAAFNGAIDVHGLGITDLSGIEAFTSLTSLDCNSNQLTSLSISNNNALVDLNCALNQLGSLDVTNNPLLVSLACGGNQLTNLDVTNCTNLNSLSFYDNFLSAIDVSYNTALTGLYIYNNQLSTLDISNNTSLIDLLCYSNALTHLDVTNNPALVYLYCFNNPLIGLDVSSNTALQWLRCNGNQLTSLDVSNNTSLLGLYCFDNQLTDINVSFNTALVRLYCANNQLTNLNVQNGNNSNFLAFDATANPLLSCIQVDDVVYATNNWTNIDPGASFSTNCSCPPPSLAGIISGANSVAACINQLGIRYSIDTIPNATGYNWNLPPLATIVSNADSNVVFVDYDAYSTSGLVSVSGTNACGIGPASTLAVNFKSIPVVEICRTTVDSSSQKTLIEWQKPIESYVDGYAIYRDSAGTFIKIEIVSNSLFSSYLDTGSHPEIKAEKYKIAVLDSCGNIGEISAPSEHQTIRLYGSIQPGGISKLYWNDYVGISDPLRYYRILRDTLGNGPLNDTLAPHISPASFMNFTDANSGMYPLSRYLVEMTYNSNCSPSFKTGLSTTRSNIKNRLALFDSSSVGIYTNKVDNFNFTLYPNPAVDFITLTFAGASKTCEIQVKDILGKTVLSRTMDAINTKQTISISVADLKEGIYFFELKTDKFNGIRKFNLIK